MCLEKGAQPLWCTWQPVLEGFPEAKAVSCSLCVVPTDGSISVNHITLSSEAIYSSGLHNVVYW